MLLHILISSATLSGCELIVQDIMPLGDFKTRRFILCHQSYYVQISYAKMYSALVWKYWHLKCENSARQSIHHITTAQIDFLPDSLLGISSPHVKRQLKFKIFIPSFVNFLSGFLVRQSLLHEFVRPTHRAYMLYSTLEGGRVCGGRVMVLGNRISSSILVMWWLRENPKFFKVNK